MDTSRALRPPEPGLVDDLAVAFSTGTGLPYDRHGAGGGASASPASAARP
jgi:hypothetical protein